MKPNLFSWLFAARRHWAILALVFGLAVSRASAQSSVYENDGSVIDPSPIDATNFINNGYFNTDYPFNTFFETEDTLNYTNNGYMFGFFGFNFDNYSTASSIHGPAASFDNENEIECGSELNIWATNIVNPGYIYVDNNLGLLQLSGQSVNLDNAFFQIAGGPTQGFANPMSEDYGVGTDTNGDWSPFNVLGATFAQSSEFNTTIFRNKNFDILTLFNSTCYFQIDTPATNDTIIRAVFVQDDNGAPAVMHNVYFGPSSLGSGLLTVEWTGIFTNNATAQLVTNYLDLNDEPAIINSNNVNLVRVNNGIPNNYTIAGSPSSLFPGVNPSPEGFVSAFAPGFITNNYSYLEAQFIATTISTNNLADTNVSAIGGRIMIQATNELSMKNSQMSGENYMRLSVTNEFDGNAGAPVSAPFSDIAVGVTNGVGPSHGNLSATNLLLSSLPYWGGTVQAWSTRWLQLITNSTVVISNGLPVSTNSYTVTNDYRVLLVNSDIFPTSPSQVQSLSIAGTNSVVIGDTFNIYGSLYINAQSLTVTTNGVGNGFDSLEGGLNFENNNILWPSSLPNLLWFTNNGSINIGNLANFGSAAPSYITNTVPTTNVMSVGGQYGAFINNGELTDFGSQIYAGYFQNSGIINNGLGSFTLNSTTAILTNGEVLAYYPFPPSFTNGLNGSISITANTLIISNSLLAAGGGLSFQVTNLMTDTGVSNGSLWFSDGGSALTGLNLPLKPTAGDVLGTTVYLLTPTPNKLVKNYWSGTDFGVSTAGYNNNEAIGQLILDVTSANSFLYFSAPPASTGNNAIYVDRLVLTNYASYVNGEGTKQIPTLLFTTNLVIYYADALASSTVNGGGTLEDVSYLLNNSNGGHLRWVPQYTGFFSSVSFVYPNGMTNILNAGLVDSPYLDSNGNGIPNAADPAPVFEPSQVNFKFAITNVSGTPMALLTWDSIPSATNYVLYVTNLMNFTNMTGQSWFVVTNFVSPATVPPIGGWPITNVLVEPLDLTAPHGYYRVAVSPDSADYYGQ